MRNEFIYRKARQECEGKSDVWVKQAINEVLEMMTAQIERTGRTPDSEQLDRIESTLEALDDELKERGIK
jgi:hypothetical protein